MNRIDHDLHELLTHAAGTVPPPTDPWPGIRRRARRFRARRLTGAAAGGVLALAAVGVAVPALLPGDLGRSTAPAGTGDVVQDGPIASPASVTCETGSRIAYPEVADGLRLLADPPAGMVLEGSRAMYQPACELRPDGIPQEVLVRTAPDGTVEAAVTLWTSSEAPEAVGPEGRDGPEGTASPGDTFAPWSWPTVAGTQAQLLTPADDLARIWWTEGGELLSVSASGLDPDDVVGLAEGVVSGPSGWHLVTDELDAGLRPLPFPPAVTVEETSVEWQASWGSDLETDDVLAVSLTVGPNVTPWQAGLAQQLPGSAQLVEVGGLPAVLTDNGGASVGILTWQAGDGVRAQLFGSLDGTRQSLLPFAESLTGVAADDPRILPPS